MPSPYHLFEYLFSSNAFVCDNIMRVKQTARKSTGTTTQRSSARKDPVRHHMTNLLQTKRKSTTPKRQTEAQAYPSRGKRLPSAFYEDSPEAVKVKPRYKPGQLALKEIKKLQKGWEMLIPRAPFHRLVRELTQHLHAENEPPLRFQTAALEALQEAAEAYLLGLFEDSYLCTIHAKRVTLFVVDMQLVARLRRQRGT